ncbi:uncharacterized protein [Onthophagus taurus]|uniref:uncharacterized protein n=1 Tax=Onthophagus taurus TaxID=166361 RepID=UPI0039BEBF30
MAQLSIVIFRFLVLLFIVLCFYCEVLECSSSNKHSRRHDIHRIVIKPKRKTSYKKPYSHIPHDYHHYTSVQDEMFDPYNAEPSHHLDSSPIMDDPIQYMSPHHGFSSRYREPERYKEFNKDYKERLRYRSYKPYPSSSLQHYEFEPYKPGYADYKSYREMMEEYNRKQEDEFRRQLEKAKMQMHFAQQQQLEQQQSHQMRGQDVYQYGESQERPIWNAPDESGLIKGDWSPMSHSESPSHISPSYTKPSTFNLPLSTTPQTSQYIDLTKLDMTTSQPQRLLPLISAKNSSKSGNGGKQKINYNFSPNYFPNHKPESGVINENDDKPKDLKEYSAVVSTSYSTLWGNNNQNDGENVDESGKYQTTSGSYGSRTKIKRTKRPATYGNH